MVMVGSIFAMRFISASSDSMQVCFVLYMLEEYAKEHTSP